ncbi:MAG: MFS transporter [Promethearchaeota archaeon]|jgi:MFS family permease
MVKESQTISLIPILLVNFIGSLGFSIVLPFLVFLVIRFSGNSLLFGLMAAVYPFFQLIGAPILGKWSDRFGRRKILFLSQAGTTFAWVLLLFALFIPVVPLVNVQTEVFGVFFISVPFIVLLVARALDGITGGNISVANAYIADVSTDKTRKKNFGRMAVSSNLGFIVGPALAGILGATIYQELLPILVAFSISAVALVLIHWFLPESKPCISEEVVERKGFKKIFGFQIKECVTEEEQKRFRLKDVLSLPHVSFLLFLTFLIFLGFNFFYTAFPIHAAMTLKWSIPDLGVFFVVLSGLMAVVQGPVLGRLSDKVADSTLIMVGGIVLGTNIYVIYIAAVLFAVGNGLMWPSFLSFLSKSAGSKYQGSVQGFASSFGGVASIIGLIAGGVLYAYFDVTTFLLSAVLIYFVVVLSLVLVRIEKKIS